MLTLKLLIFCVCNDCLTVGAFRALEERYGTDFRKNLLITGDSAGSLFCLALALDISVDTIAVEYQILLENARNVGAIGKGDCTVDLFLERMIAKQPSEKAALAKLNGRLHIGYTSFPYRHVWCTYWETIDELKADFYKSAHVPLYSGGRWLHDPFLPFIVDGSCSAHGECFAHGDETLCIGVNEPFDINIPASWPEKIYPPSLEEYEVLHDRGYNKVKEWDGKLVPKIGRKHPNYKVFPVFWFLRIVEQLFCYIAAFSFFILFFFFVTKRKSA